MGDAIETSPREIAKRVRILIARKDRGDITVAARRLELSIDDVFHLEKLLSADASRPRTTLLASIVRRYDADACWLLTGRKSSRLADLPPEARVEVAQLLSEIGNRIIAEYREQRPTFS